MTEALISVRKAPGLKRLPRSAHSEAGGADVVGMTNVPEAQLAREAEICYSTISMVTNFAAGMSSEPLTHSEVLECMNRNISHFQQIISVLASSYDTDRDCSCRHAASEFGGFQL